MRQNQQTSTPSEVNPRRAELVPNPGRRSGDHAIFDVYQHSPTVLGVTLQDVFDVFKKRRLYLLIGLLAGIELAVLMLAVTTPLFAVSARVVITQQAPGELIDTDSGSSAFIATQAEILHSPRVVQAAVDSLPDPDHLDPEEDKVAAAMDAVHASAIAGTRVVALGYLGSNPDYGAALLKAMIDAYLSEVHLTTRSGQANLFDTKDDELETLLENIAEKESKIRELSQVNAIVGNAEEAAAAQAGLLKDQVQALTEARNKRIELEARLATGGSEMLENDPLRKSLQEDLRRAESELAIAKRTLTREHPSVKAAQSNVQVLRSQLASNANSSRKLLQQQIDEALRLEQELAAIELQSRARLEGIERHRQQENKLLGELTRMQAQADRWRGELFDQQLITRLAKSGDVGIGARIIEEPIVPLEPVWPNKILLVVGALLGFSIAFILALVSLRRQQQRDVVKW